MAWQWRCYRSRESVCVTTSDWASCRVAWSPRAALPNQAALMMSRVRMDITLSRGIPCHFSEVDTPCLPDTENGIVAPYDAIEVDRSLARRTCRRLSSGPLACALAYNIVLAHARCPVRLGTAWAATDDGPKVCTPMLGSCNRVSELLTPHPTRTSDIMVLGNGAGSQYASPSPYRLTIFLPSHSKYGYLYAA
jgi:hypothetical protein